MHYKVGIAPVLLTMQGTNSDSLTQYFSFFSLDILAANWNDFKLAFLSKVFNNKIYVSHLIHKFILNISELKFNCKPT